MVGGCLKTSCRDVAASSRENSRGALFAAIKLNIRGSVHYLRWYLLALQPDLLFCVSNMSEKRRLSTRNRGEPPLKRRAVTPLPPPAPPVPPPRPVEPTELGLPIRLRDGQPLPTLPEPQERNLPDRTYQSISERSVTPYLQNLRFI